MTDFNTGGFTVHLDEGRYSIGANIRTVRIKRHLFENINLRDFIVEFGTHLVQRDPATLNIHRATEGCVHRRTTP